MVLSVCLVKENTLEMYRLSFRVSDWYLRAKITGTPSSRPAMTAGAMPEASMVTILVMPWSRKRMANA
ncbi:Uncharacterised protein [Klebsiella pneumoniae]|nr:Uncharacterised protein [Klebsiella pneumoniae]